MLMLGFGVVFVAAQFDKGSKHQATLNVMQIKGVTRDYTGEYVQDWNVEC